MVLSAMRSVIQVCFYALVVANFAAAASPEIVAISTPFAQRNADSSGKLFSRVAPDQCGLVTVNKYDEATEWGEKFIEFNNGSLGTGVAIGDFDNDGLPDYLISNKSIPCRLYKNRGNFRFEDVTECCGLLKGQTEGSLTDNLMSVFRGDSTSRDRQNWNEGVAFVDVNNDGLLDIYICRYNAPNLLYINQGDGTFREEAKQRGGAGGGAGGGAAGGGGGRGGRRGVGI